MSQAPPTRSRRPESTASVEQPGSEAGPRRAEGGFPVVGIVGAGQLARMCQPPAVALSVTLSVLADDADDAAALVVPHSPVGHHDDLAALHRLAGDVDVVTFDHEHVPADALAALAADGVPMHPTPEALVFAQDKVAMRNRLTELGVPCPRWAVARSAEQVQAFGDDAGWPIVAKTPRGGYDGKGVRIIHEVADLVDWLDAVGDDGPLVEGILLEEAVPFSREVAALVARNPSGDTVAWPLVETVQTDGICTEVLAPAPDLDVEAATAATQTAERIASELGVTGVLAVELFEVPGRSGGPDGAGTGGGSPTYVVNELAMRPHNSGHWTIDGAATSQFEQHLRAILDLPLGPTEPRATWTVMANVLGGDRRALYAAVEEVLADDPGLRIHLYGKHLIPGRKIGHVTVCGDDLTEARARARRAADHLRGATPT